jgi:hypothetical protein
VAQSKIHTVGIIMNGVTGRMGTNQHLMRSIVAVREQGGVKLDGGERIMPEPVLVGRNAEKLQALIWPPRWPIRRTAFTSTRRRPIAACRP